jgi:hypothetical protein
VKAVAAQVERLQVGQLLAQLLDGAPIAEQVAGQVELADVGRDLADRRLA